MNRYDPRHKFFFFNEAIKGKATLGWVRKVFILYSEFQLFIISLYPLYHIENHGTENRFHLEKIFIGMILFQPYESVAYSNTVFAFLGFFFFDLIIMLSVVGLYFCYVLQIHISPVFYRLKGLFFLYNPLFEYYSTIFSLGVLLYQYFADEDFSKEKIFCIILGFVHLILIVAFYEWVSPLSFDNFALEHNIKNTNLFIKPKYYRSSLLTGSNSMVRMKWAYSTIAVITVFCDLGNVSFVFISFAFGVYFYYHLYKAPYFSLFLTSMVLGVYFEIIMGPLILSHFLSRSGITPKFVLMIALLIFLIGFILNLIFFHQREKRLITYLEYFQKKALNNENEPSFEFENLEQSYKKMKKWTKINNYPIYQIANVVIKKDLFSPKFHEILTKEIEKSIFSSTVNESNPNLKNYKISNDLTENEKHCKESEISLKDNNKKHDVSTSSSLSSLSSSCIVGGRDKDKKEQKLKTNERSYFLDDFDITLHFLDILCCFSLGIDVSKKICILLDMTDGLEDIEHFILFRLCAFSGIFGYDLSQLEKSTCKYKQQFNIFWINIMEGDFSAASEVTQNMRRTFNKIILNLKAAKTFMPQNKLLLAVEENFISRIQFDYKFDKNIHSNSIKNSKSCNSFHNNCNNNKSINNNNENNFCNNSSSYYTSNGSNDNNLRISKKLSQEIIFSANNSTNHIFQNESASCSATQSVSMNDDDQGIELDDKIMDRLRHILPKGIPFYFFGMTLFMIILFIILITLMNLFPLYIITQHSNINLIPFKLNQTLSLGTQWMRFHFAAASIQNCTIYSYLNASEILALLGSEYDDPTISDISISKDIDNLPEISSKFIFFLHEMMKTPIFPHTSENLTQFWFLKDIKFEHDMKVDLVSIVNFYGMTTMVSSFNDNHTDYENNITNNRCKSSLADFLTTNSQASVLANHTSTIVYHIIQSFEQTREYLKSLKNDRFNFPVKHYPTVIYSIGFIIAIFVTISSGVIKIFHSYYSYFILKKYFRPNYHPLDENILNSNEVKKFHFPLYTLMDSLVAFTIIILFFLCDTLILNLFINNNFYDSINIDLALIDIDQNGMYSSFSMFLLMVNWQFNITIHNFTKFIPNARFLAIRIAEINRKVKLDVYPEKLNEQNFLQKEPQSVHDFYVNWNLIKQTTLGKLYFQILMGDKAYTGFDFPKNDFNSNDNETTLYEKSILNEIGDETVDIVPNHDDGGFQINNFSDSANFDNHSKEIKKLFLILKKDLFDSEKQSLKHAHVIQPNSKEYNQLLHLTFSHLMTSFTSVSSHYTDLAMKVNDQLYNYCVYELFISFLFLIIFICFFLYSWYRVRFSYHQINAIFSLLNPKFIATSDSLMKYAVGHSVETSIAKKNVFLRLFNDIKIPIILISDHKTIVGFTKEVQKIFNYSREEQLIGQKINLLIPKNEKFYYMLKMSKTYILHSNFGEKQTITQEVEGQKSDGELFNVIVHVTVLSSISIDEEENSNDNNKKKQKKKSDNVKNIINNLNNTTHFMIELESQQENDRYMDMCKAHEEIFNDYWIGELPTFYNYNTNMMLGSFKYMLNDVLSSYDDLNIAKKTINKNKSDNINNNGLTSNSNISYENNNFDNNNQSVVPSILISNQSEEEENEYSKNINHFIRRTSKTMPNNAQGSFIIYNPNNNNINGFIENDDIDEHNFTGEMILERRFIYDERKFNHYSFVYVVAQPRAMSISKLTDLQKYKSGIKNCINSFRDGIVLYSCCTSAVVIFIDQQNDLVNSIKRGVDFYERFNAEIEDIDKSGILIHDTRLTTYLFPIPENLQESGNCDNDLDISSQMLDECELTISEVNKRVPSPLIEVSTKIIGLMPCLLQKLKRNSKIISREFIQAFDERGLIETIAKIPTNSDEVLPDLYMI